MFAADTMDPLGEVGVGPHPNAMVLSKDGSRLFVACANTNAVWVVDLATSESAKEQISVALYPNAPVGTTPNSLALSPDGTTLLVANADNNTVAVVDVEDAGCEPGGRMGSGRLVPDVGVVHAGRLSFLRAERQRADERTEPARAAARRRARWKDDTPRNMLQGALSIVQHAGRDGACRR